MRASSPTGRRPVDPSTRSEPQLVRFAWILYLIFATLAAIWIAAREGQIGLDLFVRPETALRDAGVGVASGVAVALVWRLSATRFELARRLEGELMAAVGRIERGDVVALALLSGFAEELFFRGAMQPSWGLVPTAVIFALLHSGPGRVFVIWGVFALGAGLGLGALFAWSGSLLAPVAAHVVTNLIGLDSMRRRWESDPPVPRDPPKDSFE